MPSEDPPTPQWIEDAWISRGRPEVNGSDPYGPKGRALLWFVVSAWCAARRPYRFALSRPLLTWLNAADLDFTEVIPCRPTLDGAVPSGAFKPVSRYMRAVWEERNRHPTLADMDGYFDFIAEFAFTILPASNAPAGLLPPDIIELLNTPADGEDLPLTVGMLSHIKRAYPHDYQQLGKRGREDMLAICRRATKALLETKDPRLIPLRVSQFWMRRSVGTDESIFQYPKSHAAHSGATDRVEPLPDESSLHSGSSGDVSAVGSLVRIQDRALLIYRDHVTVAGLSRAGAIMSSAFKGAGLPTFDLNFVFGRTACDAEAKQNREHWINARRKVHIFSLNPEYVPECMYSNLPQIGIHDYLVGHFFWELPMVSRVHEAGIAMMDEIWTASRFLTQVYEAATNKPVITMGLAIPVKGTFTSIRPEQFGYSSDTFLFLCSFDAGSSIERKNPLGTVIAFQTAFPRRTVRVGLIIKTRNLEGMQTERDKVHWARAMKRIGKDHRIRVVEHTMSEDELIALYRMCGCFVSLHRSEGFGLGPAEAMAQAKPTIVTNYSSVRDFCKPETAKLVEYELIRVNHDEYPFLDSDRAYEWADPDLEMAAEHMRMLAEDREHGKRLGRAGRELIVKEYSIDALRNRYLARLEQLGFGPIEEIRAKSAAC